MLNRAGGIILCSEATQVIENRVARLEKEQQFRTWVGFERFLESLTEEQLQELALHWRFPEPLPEPFNGYGSRRRIARTRSCCCGCCWKIASRKSGYRMRRIAICGNCCGIATGLVQMRTRVMNQLHVVALNEGLRRKKALWRPAGRAELEGLSLAPSTLLEMGIFRQQRARSPRFARGCWPDDAPPRKMMLLEVVQLLIDQHRHEHQQKYPRPDAEHAHGDGKPVDLGQQFRLLLVHVRTRVIQKQLIIPVHGECALVDQEDDQTNCENPEDHRH